MPKTTSKVSQTAADVAVAVPELRIGKKNLHHFPFLGGLTKSSSYFKMIVFENQISILLQLDFLEWQH